MDSFYTPSGAGGGYQTNPSNPADFYNLVRNTAPQQMPTMVTGAPGTKYEGKPVDPRIAPFVYGMQQAILRRKQEQEEAQRDWQKSHTTTRHTPGSYASMSGPERNLAAMYERQWRMMRNNPQLAPGYWGNSGIKPVTTTPVWR